MSQRSTFRYAAILDDRWRSRVVCRLKVALSMFVASAIVLIFFFGPLTFLTILSQPLGAPQTNIRMACLLYSSGVAYERCTR